MNRHQIIHNFTVLSRTTVDELNAVLWQMEHKNSGAHLVWLERTEENKTFGIAFPTHPWNDTGIFHILEHSVLCGSDRYPVKEPFVELMKSSLHTFLNAMTFPDKTFYPVSSRNNQDLINLIRVYMDAVLHPLIHSTPEIFYQEGCHYELQEDGTLSYKGVVFNEMKGAFASPDTLLERELNRCLFPDTCYQYVSGGDPEHIPDLTYEQFTTAHHQFYHPSNAYIFLDGSIDIEKILEILDTEFLSSYSRAQATAPIPIQQPVDAGTAEITYELSSQESLEGRARLVDGYVACTFQDTEELTALQVLSDVLCGDNQSPLMRKLLERGLARNVQMNLHDGILQPWITLEARDIQASQAQAVSAALQDELERLVSQGLDHSRILATLDHLEFLARQRYYGSMPQGLVFGLQVLGSWLYGGDPAAHLSVGSRFDSLRKKCGEGYFEKLLEQVLLRNPHKCKILMHPSHTIGQERKAQEIQRLESARAGWSKEDMARIRQQQQNITAWQSAPDTPRALSTIPVLNLTQVQTQPERLPLVTEVTAGLPILRHELSTNGITYLNLYFALDDFTPEQLTKAALLAQLLGTLATENRKPEIIQQEIRSTFGQLQFAVEAYGQKGMPAQCRAFFCVSCSVLNEKIEKAAAFLSELMTKTLLDDAEQILIILRQCRAAMAQQMIMAGHSAAIGRTLACATAEGAVKEQTGGITFLRWLTQLEQNFSCDFPALAKDLHWLVRTIFSRKRLTVSVTGTLADAAQICANTFNFWLPEGQFSLSDAPTVRPWGRKREGIIVPADVSFSALGGLFPAAGKGAAKVMGRAISLDYLWNAVRVQGGAYGVGMLLQDTGYGGFYSFRDPSPARTLGCYRSCTAFLEQMRPEDLTGMIIGAVAESDPLLMPHMKGKAADAYYWRQFSYKDLCQLRQEILSTTPKDLMTLSDDLDAFTSEGSICVIGPQSHIDTCSGQLDSVSFM